MLLAIAITWIIGASFFLVFNYNAHHLDTIEKEDTIKKAA